MTANSALNQNWVGCTVRTPRTQVARTLRAQCPGRGRCCAHNKQVARMSCPTSAGRGHAGRALVATRPGRMPPGRDLTLMSRHQGSQNHVATSNRCRDIVSPGQPKPGRDIKTRSRPSWRRTYVATSISCRDLISAHIGISRSRHQNSRSRPPPQPPMLRHQIHVATPFLPNKSRPGRDATSCRDLCMSRPPN